MTPDIAKIDPNGDLELGPSAWNFSNEVLRWLLHGNSVLLQGDLLIPFLVSKGGVARQER